MKNIIIPVIAFFCILTSCKPAPFIKISTADVSLATEQSEQYLNFETNYDWILSTDANWLTISPTSGVSGEIKIRLTASANESRTDRTGNITITSEGVTNKFNIRQAGRTYYLKLSHSNKEMSAPAVEWNGSATGEINWGDGKTEQYSLLLNHVYPSAGNYTLKISGEKCNAFVILALTGVSEIEYNYESN